MASLLRRWLRAIESWCFDGRRIARLQATPAWTAVHRIGSRAGLLADPAGAWQAEIGADARLFLADLAPDAIDGRPMELVAFAPWSSRPLMRLQANGTVERDGVPLIAANPARRDLSLIAAPARQLALPRAGPPLMATLPPLGKGFPPTDLPLPPAGSPQPTPGPPVANACPPVYLFYGLCFQTPDVPPEEAPAGMDVGDPLWPETTLLASNFAVRGYRKWQGCAGSGAGAFADFDALMTAMAADLAAQTTFCSCVDDQLVIFIAGHGYGANPTGEVAVLFQRAKGKKEWVSWTQLLDRLAKVITNPAKTYLIVESCRSGLIFEPGRVPGALRGLNVLTCTADAATLGPYPHFGGAVTDAAGQLGAQDWDHFIRLVKWRASQWGTLTPLPGYPPYGLPRNGTLGCRYQVVVTTVAYGGADIGNLWEYRFTIAGTSIDVAEHVLAFNGTETLNLVLYDRLHERCPSPVVDLVLKVDATETTGRNTSGRGSRPISRACDGGSQTLTLGFVVGNATLTVTLQVTTTC